MDIMKKVFAALIMTTACTIGTTAQQYKVPVTNEKETMAEGPYQPQWESLIKHKTPNGSEMLSSEYGHTGDHNAWKVLETGWHGRCI